MATTLALAGCSSRFDQPDLPELAPEGERVEIRFQVAVPTDGPATKAMGNNPTIDPDGFYIAVFGGSGYFNEWIKATVVSATANYDGTAATCYTLSATFGISDSRLRLHFIANCPTAIRTSPPISGSQDTEENVMSQIRSQLSDSYNDGYWQKIILPIGVKATKNPETEIYEATPETLRQFPSPIVMVRNFARIYLRNITPIVAAQGVTPHQLVTIKKYALAYAPSEGVIAPILENPYSANAKGTPIDTTGVSTVFYESFLMNYQRYSIYQNQADTLLTGAPFNYSGYSPSDQAYQYYNDQHADRGIPVAGDMITWDAEHPENNVLYVYERSIPSTTHRATRIIILAERRDQYSTESGDEHSEGDKYYALDIVNSEGSAIPILRNQSYTVHLKDIEPGTGETDITKAAKASSATVSGDPDFQDLITVSDGKSSIGTSFTEKFYVQPQEDYVMFRYIPTNIAEDGYEPGQEGNELVSIKVGSVNGSTGVFTELTPAQAATDHVLAFNTQNGKYKVWIDTTVVQSGRGAVIQYIRANNAWVAATDAQIANPNLEKWGKIRYDLNRSEVSDGFFTEERAQAIRVVGRFKDREITRNVIIKISPRQEMKVVCLQKYIHLAPGEREDVRVMIPKGLSRSVFPLEFIIEPDGYSLTPNGDVLPVESGSSIVPGRLSPAFYFIKNLTQTAYDNLGTIDYDGKTWKYFDCHFKTTLSQNACTVYVQNQYFSTTDAYDNFYNFQQRLFTDLSFSTNSMYAGGPVTFSFVLDKAHTGPTVWWDPTNSQEQSDSPEQAVEKGLSTNNRVLPLVLSFTLDGLNLEYDTDGTTPMTNGIEHYSGNTYLYHVGAGNPALHTNTGIVDNPIQLRLVASGSTITPSVTLSTANLLYNPELYHEASQSGSLSTAALQNCSFTPARLAYGVNRPISFTFHYVEGMVEPLTISLDGLALDGSDARITGTAPGPYTFTPTSENTTEYTINLKSTTRYSNGSITLFGDHYIESTTRVSRSLILPAGSIKARGYNGVDPIRLVTNNNSGGTGVIVSETEAGSGGTIYFNTSFLNRETSVDVGSFGSPNDNSIVYARYVIDGKTFKGSTTLGAIVNAIENNTFTPINIYRWTTEDTVSFDFTNSNNYHSGRDSHSYTHNDSGIRATFVECPGKNDAGRNYRKDIGYNSGNTYIDGTITISNGTKTGCKLTGINLTYFRSGATTYNQKNVTINGVSKGTGVTSWTSPNSGVENGETEIVIVMNCSKNNGKVNAITNLTINYGYWDY